VDGPGWAERQGNPARPRLHGRDDIHLQINHSLIGVSETLTELSPRTALGAQFSTSSVNLLSSKSDPDFGSPWRAGIEDKHLGS
jgi:hypothetical protein